MMKIEIDRIGLFRLFEILGGGSNGWRNFRVELDYEYADKWSWRLGHNGERFAAGRDFYSLRELHPEALVWVRDNLKWV